MLTKRLVVFSLGDFRKRSYSVRVRMLRRSFRNVNSDSIGESYHGHAALHVCKPAVAERVANR
jgi:hypothetical protein